MDIEAAIEYYTKVVPEEVTHSRFDHSILVAELAEKFSILNYYPEPRKAYLAGILHDITKQNRKNFIGIFLNDTISISSLFPIVPITHFPLYFI